MNRTFAVTPLGVLSLSSTVTVGALGLQYLLASPSPGLNLVALAGALVSVGIAGSAMLKARASASARSAVPIPLTNARREPLAVPERASEAPLAKAGAASVSSPPPSPASAPEARAEKHSPAPMQGAATGARPLIELGGRVTTVKPARPPERAGVARPSVPPPVPTPAVSAEVHVAAPVAQLPDERQTVEYVPGRPSMVILGDTIQSPPPASNPVRTTDVVLSRVATSVVPPYERPTVEVVAKRPRGKR
jgi:hypothetical protein